MSPIRSGSNIILSAALIGALIGAVVSVPTSLLLVFPDARSSSPVGILLGREVSPLATPFKVAVQRPINTSPTPIPTIIPTMTPDRTVISDPVFHAPTRTPTATPSKNMVNYGNAVALVALQDGTTVRLATRTLLYSSRNGYVSFRDGLDLVDGQGSGANQKVSFKDMQAIQFETARFEVTATVTTADSEIISGQLGNGLLGASDELLGVSDSGRFRAKISFVKRIDFQISAEPLLLPKTRIATVYPVQGNPLAVPADLITYYGTLDGKWLGGFDAIQLSDGSSYPFSRMSRLEIVRKNEDGVEVRIQFSDGKGVQGTVPDRTVPFLQWEGSSLVGPTETGEVRLRFDPSTLRRIEFGN